jgi:carbon storage regulator
MLILTRKLGESIAIGDEIRIHLLDIKGSKVRIGIEAPRGVCILREELYRIIRDENIEAANAGALSDMEIGEIWERLMNADAGEEQHGR